MTAPLIEAPRSDEKRVVSPLAYVEAYDAVLDDDFAYVAYQETDRSTRTWRVHIRGLHSPGATLDPVGLVEVAREAAARGANAFPVGYRVEPRASDPRRIEFLVHVTGGKPASVELVLQTRLASGGADVPRIASFAWPTGPAG